MPWSSRKVWLNHSISQSLIQQVNHEDTDCHCQLSVAVHITVNPCYNEPVGGKGMTLHPKICYIQGSVIHLLWRPKFTISDKLFCHASGQSVPPSPGVFCLPSRIPITTLSCQVNILFHSTAFWNIVKVKKIRITSLWCITCIDHETVWR